ncbi:MAG: hypothetical protein QM765_34595 [Myxococcales bacterium]
MWGSAADDLWAVGSAGSMFHWDGHTWTSACRGTTVPLEQVWGSGPDNLWAGGHFRRESTDENPFYDYVLTRWDGHSWTTVPAPKDTSYGALTGSGPDDVWLVGSPTPDGANLHRWDGASWTDTTSPYRKILVTGRDDAWGTSGASVDHWDGSQWTPSKTFPANVFRLAAASSTDVWALLENSQIHKWDGTTLSLPGQGPMDAFWPYSTAGVWEVSRGEVQHWDGTAWKRIVAPHWETTGIWGDASEAWISAGDPALPWVGSLIHCDQSACTEDPRWTRGAFYGVWASGAGDLWFVGEDGAILHRK